MSDVTRILQQVESGDPSAAAELLPLVYDELRTLAAAKLSKEKPGQTLQATALVHEAYLRLVGDRAREQSWDSRGHFFAAAAEAMRRILIDNARHKLRAKRGGYLQRVNIELADLPTRMTSDDLIALDEALTALAKEDPLKARLITLRYFGGLTSDQAAEALGISRVTAFRHWTYARAWLHQRIEGRKTAP